MRTITGWKTKTRQAANREITTFCFIGVNEKQPLEADLIPVLPSFLTLFTLNSFLNS